MAVTGIFISGCVPVFQQKILSTRQAVYRGKPLDFETVHSSMNISNGFLQSSIN